MKKSLLVLACLCAVSLLALLVAAKISPSMGKQAGKHGNDSINDSVRLEKEVAYAETLKVSDQVQYFKQLSDSAGAAYAYEVLRRLPSDDSDKHLFGHIIGNELYNEQGLEGLSICTPEFTFACYHSLIGQAIGALGLDDIGEINQKCLALKDVGSCEHGVGHGIMAAIGYKDPVSAVAVCDSIEKGNGFNRPCIEGVIMEFNFRQLEGITTTTHRPVDEKGYNYPCSEMPQADTNECFFEQTLWWRELLGRTNYPAIGALCDMIKNEGNRAWCYRGIGRLIPEYSHDPIGIMAASCIASTAAKEGQALCLQMLHTWTKNDASVCDLLQGEYADTCRSPMPELTAG